MIDAPGAAPLLPPWRVERILYDADGVLVVDKPVGISVTGGDDANPHSVLRRLTTWLNDQGRARELRAKLSLDEEMSGVVLVSLASGAGASPTDHKAPGASREAHPYKRTYLAVVARDAKCQLKSEGTLTLPGESAQGSAARKSPRRSASAGRASAANRLIQYRVLRENGTRALLEVRLDTDRPQDARLALARVGAPIVGDRMHGGAPAFRLMFHAQRLQGPEVEVEAPTPLAFSQALAGESAETPVEDAALRHAMWDAACLREPLLARSATFRLINGAGDGLPGFTVDAYGAFATLNIYDAALLPRVSQIAANLGEIGFTGVYLKQRVKADLRSENATELAPDEVVFGGSAPETYLVDEFGMQLHIELADGLSTGLFVDMRDNRVKARAWSAARRTGLQPQMLNLFCYTCSFSVSAALSGAVTTSVDLAGKALERGRANFVANGLDPEAHRFIREDAMKFLVRAARRGEKYDFIVLDPPSFATVGKGTFSVKNQYGEAVEGCLRVLSPGGRLLCVTNHTKTSEAALRSTIEAAAARVQRRVRSLKGLNPGIDCPPHPDGLWPSKSALCELE